MKPKKFRSSIDIERIIGRDNIDVILTTVRFIIDRNSIFPFRLRVHDDVLTHLLNQISEFQDSSFDNNVYIDVNNSKYSRIGKKNLGVYFWLPYRNSVLSDIVLTFMILDGDCYLLAVQNFKYDDF